MQRRTEIFQTFLFSLRISACLTRCSFSIPPNRPPLLPGGFDQQRYSHQSDQLLDNYYPLMITYIHITHKLSNYIMRHKRYICPDLAPIYSFVFV